MKRLLLGLLTIVGLASLVKAEGTGTKYNAGDYLVYKSTDITFSTTVARLTQSAFLHKVIISSPSYSADVSTNAVLTFYNAAGATGDRFTVPFSTQDVTGGREFTFDIAMSSGIAVAASNSSHLNGKATVIYASPQAGSAGGYHVWASTYMPADTAVHRIVAGPVLLHKIIVLTKGTGTAILSGYDSYQTASPSASRKILAVDLTDTAREYNYDIYCSSGITLQSSGAGTINPKFIVLYKRNPSQDYELWRSSFTTGTDAGDIFNGQGVVFGGVVNGDSVASSYLTIYDGKNGGTSKILTKIDGTASFDKRMYDIQVSSGIGYATSGNGLYSILWKRRSN